jgi:hypothetical protein
VEGKNFRRWGRPLEGGTDGYGGEAEKEALIARGGLDGWEVVR